MKGLNLNCKKDLYMNPHAIEGKTYTVIRDTEHELAIRNEHGDIHWFDKDPKSESYYGHWFNLES